jgi:hypothetical protein
VLVICTIKAKFITVHSIGLSQRLHDKLGRAPSRNHGPLDGGHIMILATDEQPGGDLSFGSFWVRHGWRLQGEGVQDPVRAEMAPLVNGGSKPTPELRAHSGLQWIVTDLGITEDRDRYERFALLRV